MRLLSYLRSLAAIFFRRSQIDVEIDEELHAHIQCRADDLVRSGLDRGEAERRARVEFGGRQRFKEEARDALGGSFIESLMQDLRFNARILRKSPGFTAVAVLTLAIAIGANAVVFGILNALVLRPLNLPQADSLYEIQRPGGWGYQSYPDYLDLRDRNRSFDGLAAYNIAAAGLDTGQDTTRVSVYEVSGNYFDVLGLQPHLGRFFHAADEHGPNSAPYIVLTHAYWHVHFQDDPRVVGRIVKLNKHPFTILGVAAPEFHGTLLFFSPDFFVPIVNQEQVEGVNKLNARGNRWVFQVMGHLKAGVTPIRAMADLNSLGAWLERTYPKDDSKMSFSLGRPGLAGDVFAKPAQAFVTALMMLAGLILLAACANLGSLFAARAADRSREVALRLALGAKRIRILRQLLTEAVLISLAGGAVGLWGSVVLLNQLSAWQPLPRFPIHIPVSPDANVYAIALVLALVSGMLFGIVPVRQVLRADPYQIVKAGWTGALAGRITMRDVLMVVQVSICAVLVTSSMVAVRGLERSLHADFGVNRRNAMLVDANLSMAGYSGDGVAAMQKRMVDSVAAIPEVQAVGLVDNPPLVEGWNAAYVFTDRTVDLRPVNAIATVIDYKVSPQYFEAAGTTLLTGRTPSQHDDKNAARVAVVNREFARKLFGSARDAIGRYFKLQDGTRVQVVGVAEDGKYTTNLTENPQLAMFLPILQSPSVQTWLVVRSSRDPRQLADAIRTTMRDLDPGLPVYVETWTQGMDGALFATRVATAALSIMGIMGAMLAVTGIFGMAAYSVSKRLRELGIRMALGARRKEVLQAALGRAVKLLCWGSAAGLFLGVLSTRVLSSIVYQATPRDPMVMAGVVVAMGLLGLLATWIPAQRALSLDPVALLREE